MQTVNEIQVKYCSRALGTAVIVALLLIGLDRIPLGKGLILGTLFSVVNFVLMGVALPLKLGHSTVKTFFVSLSGIVVRFALMAVPLVVALRHENIDFVAVIVGLFSVQLFILADHLIGHFKTNRSMSS